MKRSTKKTNRRSKTKRASKPKFADEMRSVALARMKETIAMDVEDVYGDCISYIQCAASDGKFKTDFSMPKITFLDGTDANENITAIMQGVFARLKKDGFSVSNLLVNDDKAPSLLIAW